MNKSAWTAWAIKNCVVVICFAALVIYFKHWWIVLFALFLMSSYESKGAVRRVCDGCGKTIYSTDWDTIDEKSKQAGWVRRKNGEKWEDFCPECQKKGGCI